MTPEQEAKFNDIVAKHNYTPATASTPTDWFTATTPKPAAPGAPAAPKEEGGVSGFVKSVVKSPATIIARPFQAAADLGDYLGTRIEQAHATTPGAKSAILAAEQRRATEKQTQPSGPGGIIAPTPANAGDLKKDVGRAAQTVALGLGPVAGGAVFGAGNSLEQGNDLLSVQTAFQTVLGAGAGKVLQLIGQPILNASGKVIGKITPQFLASIASEGSEAVANFAATHNILPEVASKVINTTAAGAEKAANAPFKAVVAAPRLIKPGLAAAKDTKAGKTLLGGPTPEEALGQITQGKTKDLKPAVEALTAIDTKGVKTYEDLNGRFDKKIPELSAVVDTELAKDPTKYSLEALAKSDTTASGKEIRTDYVSEALKHLSELYDTTGDAVAKANIEELFAKAQAEGLTRKEVNEISRKYGIEFGDKAFSKVSGDALTSVNAQKFENVRSGLKEIARAGIGGDEAKAADHTLSSIYNTKKLTLKMQEGVNKLQQRIESRGLGEKIGHAAMKTLDMLSGGAIRGLVGGLLPRGAGYKVLNAVDLEAKLARNLELVRKATEAPTDETLTKIVQQIHSILSEDSSAALMTSAAKMNPTTNPDMK